MDQDKKQPRKKKEQSLLWLQELFQKRSFSAKEITFGKQLMPKRSHRKNPQTKDGISSINTSDWRYHQAAISRAVKY